MLLSLGFLMLAAGDLARGRRWMAAVPLVLGLACSAFGEFDVIGAVTTSWMLWFGLCFVILVLFKPEGIAGLFQGYMRSHTAPKNPAPQPAPPSLAR